MQITNLNLLSQNIISGFKTLSRMDALASATAIISLGVFAYYSNHYKRMQENHVANTEKLNNFQDTISKFPKMIRPTIGSLRIKPMEDLEDMITPYIKTHAFKTLSIIMSYKGKDAFLQGHISDDEFGFLQSFPTTYNNAYALLLKKVQNVRLLSFAFFSVSSFLLIGKFAIVPLVRKLFPSI